MINESRNAQARDIVFLHRRHLSRLLQLSAQTLPHDGTGHTTTGNKSERPRDAFTRCVVGVLSLMRYHALTYCYPPPSRVLERTDYSSQWTAEVFFSSGTVAVPLGGEITISHSALDESRPLESFSFVEKHRGLCGRTNSTCES